MHFRQIFGVAEYMVCTVSTNVIRVTPASPVEVEPSSRTVIFALILSVQRKCESLVLAQLKKCFFDRRH